MILSLTAKLPIIVDLLNLIEDIETMKIMNMFLLLHQDIMRNVDKIENPDLVDLWTRTKIPLCKLSLIISRQ